MTPILDALDHLVLTVGDIPTSVAFYRDVLGMHAASFQAADGSTRWSVSFGAQKINLHPADAPFAPHAAAPTRGSADLCFLTSQPLEQWQAHFDAHAITLEDGPVTRTGATGPICSLYLSDPDGNLIEVSIRL